MATSTPQNYKVPSTSKVSVDKLLRVGYYELEKTIGKGNFAVVKLASNVVTKSKVAIKIIDKTCLNEEYLAKTFREISILKVLRHPHITRLYEVMESQTMIYLVTEYAPNGEIFDHLVENGRMKEPEAARVFTQLVSAVQYCHGKGVVHRDLKAENVLLDKDMNIKLADFGFSNRYEEGSPLRTWCGSPPYAAPEVFQGLEYDGPKADIWSLGVVLYALVCGALPFDGKTLLELKSRVVNGKFRIPYFMSQECENLIRNMLVVEPDRRYSLKQIVRHRWLSEWVSDLDDLIPTAYANANPMMRSGSTTSCNSNVESMPNLDTVVMTHMLQLPGLTADMIAQSVHENRFDNIYAIYNLLYDKLQQKRREHQRLQHHANLAYSRSRKTSITTGVVDRSEPIKQESVDRLSPLTNTNVANAAGGLCFQWADFSVDLEKFGDLELECLARPNEPPGHNQNQLCANVPGSSGGNTRRHTVGPGDVAHEQALANPNELPINFKCSPERNKDMAGPYVPINLPMLQNQPLHNLTIKDQHLLKPPTVMGATGSFGRRASDGGANLHIYYPSSMSNMNASNNGGAGELVGLPTPISEEAAQLQQQQLNAAMNCIGVGGGGGLIAGAGNDTPGEESSEEIQRYMQIRGCAKRHTVGCTDDLSVSTTSHHNDTAQSQMSAGVTQGGVTGLGGAAGAAGGGMRTRRTGLLTVTERPPVISPELIREVESRMNRNYLPPALKMQQQNPNTNVCHHSNQSSANSIGGPSNATISSHSSNNNNMLMVPQSSPSTSLGATTPTPLTSITSLNVNAGNGRRVYARTCKLPTVQEVGRYSPVRRASEGSKAQFQGPLQECQYLQKGIAQRNFLVAPSPPLLENSISLPGSPIHGKPAQLMYRRGHEIEVPADAIKILLPMLERLVKDNQVSIEVANKIISTGMVPLDLATHLGLHAHSGNAASGGNLDIAHLQPQQMYSYSVSPLSLPNSTSTGSMPPQTEINSMGIHSKQMLGSHVTNYQFMHPQYPACGQGLIGQFSNINISTSGATPTTGGGSCFTNSNSSSGCQSPVYNSFSGSSSPNPYMPGTGPFNPIGATTPNSCSGGGSSPLHQITKGISVLTTSGGGGGGSITRGTSAASEMASANQPLDLSMDVCSGGDNLTTDHGNLYGQQAPHWFGAPSAYYDLKPLNLSPAQPVRVVPTPPASPNLCIIQEENANGQLCHTISTGTPHVGCTGGLNNDEMTSPCLPAHPQICLTDVQGSEITLVALSSDNSRDSDCDSLEPHTTAPLMSLQGLIITEPSSDMPSITRGIGRKASLDCENATLRQEMDPTVSCPSGTAHANNDSNRRGSDKSLGFSDDSLSNDSNNLSPCQEPSASSGFKSDSHSEIGDHTEGHLTPDSICDSRRMSDEMCYEVPLPHECSNLDTTRILEMVKQTISSTMPPKGFVLRVSEDNASVGNGSSYSESRASNASSITTNGSSTSSGNDVGAGTATATNLSLEYSGGLQIELQVCEGRSRDNQGAGKGIKLRRISGDQFEYGKLCQQLISTLTMQQVAG